MRDKCPHKTRDEDMPNYWDIGFQQIPNGDEWPEARRTAARRLERIAERIVCEIGDKAALILQDNTSLKMLIEAEQEQIKNDASDFDK